MEAGRTPAFKSLGEEEEPSKETEKKTNIQEEIRSLGKIKF